MKILFVCTGNTCRSPMAEGYLNSKKIKNLTASSCGLSSAGMPASANSQAVMREIGIDISAHSSRVIDSSILSADKIFCMTESHKSVLLSAGIREEKLFVLGGGISDPFGGDRDTYRKCRDEIIKSIDEELYGGTLTGYSVLPANTQDAKQIALIEKECFSCPWSEEAITESMSYNTVFFKALKDNEIVGYISVSRAAGEGYINNIAVKKEYRGEGVGSVLLDRAVTLSRSENLEFLSLEVRVSNFAAISLYKKLEFESMGIRKGFYENPKEDGIIMTRRFKV